MERITTTFRIVLLAALLMISALPCRAQDLNLARIEPGAGRIHTAAGLDPALISTLGYTRGVGLGSRTLLLQGDLSMGVASADLGDLRLRIGLQTTLWHRDGWRIAARGRMIARTTSNSVYDGQSFAADLSSHAGYYRQSWFVAGLIGYDRTFVMHLEHSDWYRENIYDGAVDGWYRAGSGILHGGLAAGIAVGIVEVAVRVELRRLDGGEALDPPIVGALSFGVPF